MSAEPQGIAVDQVRSAFQRWKNLEEEKARADLSGAPEGDQVSKLGQRSPSR